MLVKITGSTRRREMPTRKITAEEFGKRNPQAKGVFRTTKKGQKVFIAFEKKHKFPQGKGIRVSFGRKKGIEITDELRSIKKAQERAERKDGIKRGVGLFDNPLSPNPRVVGVRRVVRKTQLETQIKKFQQGKIKKLSKSALQKVQRRKGGRGKITGVIIQNNTRANVPSGTVLTGIIRKV